MTMRVATETCVDSEYHLACLILLRESLPLALAALYAGGVSADAQQGFWSAVQNMEKYNLVIDTESDTGKVADELCQDIFKLQGDLQRKALKEQ